MSDIIITIIIVCYGLKEVVFETIDSILNQTQGGIELIVSDDGSGCFSKTVVEEYIKKNKRQNITSFHVYDFEENVGTVKNLNRAIKCSHGKFIKFIGGDDAFYDENVFARQIEFLNSNPQFLLVTGLCEQCDEVLNHIEETRTEDTNASLSKIYSMPPKEAFRFYQFKGYSPFVTQAVCFRIEFFHKYGMFDEDFYLMEDAPMGAQLILKGIPVGVQQQYVVKHRTNIGISANDDYFSIRKIKYYEDRVIYCKKFIVPNIDLLGKKRVNMAYGISRFRLELAIAKKEKRSLFYNSLIGIKYLYSIILYIIMRSEKAKIAIKKVIKNH